MRRGDRQRPRRVRARAAAVAATTHQCPGDRGDGFVQQTRRNVSGSRGARGFHRTERTRALCLSSAGPPRPCHRTMVPYRAQRPDVSLTSQAPCAVTLDLTMHTAQLVASAGPAGGWPALPTLSDATALVHARPLMTLVVGGAALVLTLWIARQLTRRLGGAIDRLDGFEGNNPSLDAALSRIDRFLVRTAILFAPLMAAFVLQAPPAITTLLSGGAAAVSHPRRRARRHSLRRADRRGPRIGLEKASRATRLDRVRRSIRRARSRRCACASNTRSGLASPRRSPTNCLIRAPTCTGAHG